VSVGRLLGSSGSADEAGVGGADADAEDDRHARDVLLVSPDEPVAVPAAEVGIVA
jgi:hypothetical protein